MEGWEKLLAGAALVGGAVAALGPGGGLERLTKGPQQQGIAVALARKWAPVFGVPAAWILAICKVESNYRPGAKSPPGAADDKRGGAWGIMQVTLSTAQASAAQIARNTSAAVHQTYPKWDGTGQSLLDADLGMLFGTFLLGRLRAEFGDDFEAVASAYNHGAGWVRKRREASKPVASVYASKATAALTELVA